MPRNQKSKARGDTLQMWGFILSAILALLCGAPGCYYYYYYPERVWGMGMWGMGVWGGVESWVTPVVVFAYTMLKVRTKCTMHYALCTMHYALCTMHYALCTLSLTSYLVPPASNLLPLTLPLTSYPYSYPYTGEPVSASVDVWVPHLGSREGLQHLLQTVCVAPLHSTAGE
jgi:hypothetical protein